MILATDLKTTTKITNETINVTSKLTKEQAIEFLELKKASAKFYALGSLLCFFSPVCLILLQGIYQSGTYNISSNIANGIGLVTFLVIIGLAGAMFTVGKNKTANYDFLNEENFEVSPEVQDVVKAQNEQYKGIDLRNSVIGGFFCLIALAPIAISFALKSIDYSVLSSLYVIVFSFFGVGSICLVYNTVIKNSFKTILSK